MSDTKLKAKLPDGDANGLKGDSWRKKLIEEPLRPRVAIVIFDAPTGSFDRETNIQVPAVRLQAFEPFTDEFEERRLIKLLQNEQAKRTGATPLDIPDEQAPRDLGPLALAAPARFSFEIRSLPAGNFGLYLISATGAELGKRGGLKNVNYPEVVQGTWRLEDLPDELQRIGEVLIDEWRESDDGLDESDDASDPWEGYEDKPDGDDAA